MNLFKNTFFKSALVLSSICVVSAGAIGGLNFITESYKETHKSLDAPEEIQTLKPSGTFVQVQDFTPVSKTGDETKTRIDEVWALKEGDKTVGFAYKMNGGKPVKTDLELTVLFEGEASADDLESIQPTAVNIIVGGDSGYDSNVVIYGNGIASGSIALDSKGDFLAGGTKSQKFLRDALMQARADYANRINGGEGEQEDPVLAIMSKIFANAASYEKFDSFEPISTLYRSQFGDASGKLTEKYRVILDDGSVGYVYRAVSDEASLSGYGDKGKIDIYIGTNSPINKDSTVNDVYLSGYSVVNESTTFSYSQWEDTYLPGIVDKTLSIGNAEDISTGATISSGIIRSFLLRMRIDYLAQAKEDIENNKEAPFKAIYSTYASYVENDSWAVLEGSYNVTTPKKVDSQWKIEKEYTITLSDSSTRKVYLASTQFQFKDAEEGEDHDYKNSVYVGVSGNPVKFDGYFLESKQGYDDWKKFYDAFVKNESTLDGNVETGGTYSTIAMQGLAKAIVDAATPK